MPSLSFSARRGAVLAAAGLVAGCASVSPDGGHADVQALLAGQPLVAGVQPPAAPSPSPSPSPAPAPAPLPTQPHAHHHHGAEAAAAVPQQAADPAADAPLSQEAAVRLALSQSPRLDAAFATLQLSDAERVRAATLPNPVFAFERLVEGQGLEIDRLLRFNVLGLLVLPWQARWAGAQHEAAKLEAAQAVLLLAADTRDAWLRAVAAQQRAVSLREAREAAALGAELAGRMAQAGNWNALQAGREHLLLAQAAADSSRADQDALAARERLTRLLGLAGPAANYTLPEALPALPGALPETGELQARALAERLDLRVAQARSAQLADTLGLTRATGVVNALELGVARNTLWSGDGARSTERGWALAVPLPIFDWGQSRNARAQALYLQSAARLREVAVLAESEARETAEGRRRAYEEAQRWHAQQLPLRQRADADMLLRYNGMLASVWELLAQARTSAQARAAAVEATRDYWLADTALQLALSGSSAAGRMAALAPVPGATGLALGEAGGH